MRQNTLSLPELQKSTDLCKTTCQVLVTNLTMPLITNPNYFYKYFQVNCHSLLKLLKRVKQLYQARGQAINILKALYEIDLLFHPDSQLARVLQQRKGNLNSIQQQVIE